MFPVSMVTSKLNLIYNKESQSRMGRIIKTQKRITENDPRYKTANKAEIIRRIIYAVFIHKVRIIFCHHPDGEQELFLEYHLLLVQRLRNPCFVHALLICGQRHPYKLLQHHQQAHNHGLS